MDTRIWGFLICLFSLVLSGCAEGTSLDEAVAVRASYEGYKQAILDQDGKEAVAFVDKKTLDYYRKMLDLALRGDRETVRALSTIDKLMVLSIRHRIPSEYAEQMTAESLFVHAVDEGWIGKQWVINNELEDIAVSGTSATGVHISAGKETPLKRVFQKEDDRWRVNLTCCMPVTDQEMKKMITQSGLSEHEFLAKIVESVSGREVVDTVWEPVIKEGANEAYSQSVSHAEKGKYSRAEADYKEASRLDPKLGREPTVENETKAGKNQEIVKSFTGKSSDDGGEHAAGIKKFFDDFGAALSSGDVGRIADLFDSRILLGLLKQQGMLPDAIRQDEVLRSMDQALPSQLADPVVGVQWERYEIRGVRFVKDETEAMIYSRHWDADDISFRMRWWLFRENDKWRAYDFEDLHMAARFSTMVGVGFKMGDQRDPSVKSFPELVNAMQEYAAGDTESALVKLQELDGVAFPPVLESVRLMMIATVLRDNVDYKRAIAAADRAVAQNTDVPLVYLVYSASYNGLKQYKKALEHANRYAELLGKDADYYTEVGDAYLGMGRTTDAIQAYESGLADDAQSGHNVLGLMRVLPDDQRHAAVKYYKQLNDVDEWLVAFGQRLLREKDRKTLQTLLEIHKRVLPDSQDIVEYEKDMKNDWGVAALDDGNYEFAITLFTEAIRLDPKYVDAYNNRGNANADQGKFDAAIADYSQAIQMHPRYAIAYYNRGVAYESKGEQAKAKADFARARELGYEPE